MILCTRLVVHGWCTRLVDGWWTRLFSEAILLLGLKSLLEWNSLVLLKSGFDRLPGSISERRIQPSPLLFYLFCFYYYYYFKPIDSLSHLYQTARSCCYQLRRIISVRKYISTEVTVNLIITLILSRLDYCNSLLSGLPDSSVQSLRRIQYCAARLTLKKSVKLTISHPCFNFSTVSQSNKEFSTR